MHCKVGKRGLGVAKFQFFDGNLGFFGYDKLADYNQVSHTSTSMVLDWDTSLGALDPTQFAARVVLTYSGFASYVVEDGPDAGQERVTAGNLTGVRYLDASGATLLDITKLSGGLPIFLESLARGDSFSAWQMVTHAPNNVLGSNAANGPGHPGTGDVIDTGTGMDTVIAAGGDDYIQDRGGADSYNGGTGFDTIAYDVFYYTPWLVSRGISADLVLGQITGPDGALDSVTGIDAVTGTFRSDSFKGNANANRFEGFGGNDTIDGRGGFDLVSYGREAGQGGTDGIRVNLGTGSVRDGFGNLDHLISIEGIAGTAVRDTFIDNGGDNFFDGGAGNDSFSFGDGSDTAHGGAGADRFSFHGLAFGDDTIEDFSSAQGDKINFDAATSFAQLHISTVLLDGSQAAFVQFSTSSVTLLGLTAADLHAADFGF